MPASWHYTTFIDALDHWQSLAAGLVAVCAAVIAVGGTEFFARRKERREIEALLASLAAEIRLYVDLLIKTRYLLKVREKAFFGEKASETQRDLRDLTVLQPPTVYPTATERLGLVSRPRAAEVVAFYATIERFNFLAMAMSNEPDKKVLLPNYLVLIGMIEEACRKSLPLLAQLPVDDGDAKIRADIELGAGGRSLSGDSCRSNAKGDTSLNRLRSVRPPSRRQ